MSIPFADTALGKIFIGVTIFAGSGIVSWFASRATYEPPPLPRPAAEIVPSTLLANANEIIEFSAAGSSTPSPEQPSYRWEIGGLKHNSSPSARCNEASATLRCRFLLPGTFAVSVEVEDRNGQAGRAVSTITVSVKNGYLGLIHYFNDSNALAALLYDIDWAYLQTLVSQPIILEHPETGAPIYAALAIPDEDVSSPPPWNGAAQGLKIAVPALALNARHEFENALYQIGAMPISLASEEILLATERGAVDFGFVPIDNPGALADIAR